MSMRPLNPGLYPLGQFDLLDTEQASITGGEVVTFTTASRTNSATERAAFDARDGYLYDLQVTTTNRPAVLRASATTEKPLFLVDDGTTDYGTHFGQTIGVPVGLTVTGTDAGPHSAAASGKVTLWDKNGLYSVSVTSLAADFVSGLPLAGLTPGAVLGFGTTATADAALLSHSACANALAGSGVAYAVEFESSRSLVTTPQKLVGAAEQFPNLVVNFHRGDGDRTLGV